MTAYNAGLATTGSEIIVEQLKAAARHAAAGAPAMTFWVYRDYDGRWCLRQEGGMVEGVFASRADALKYARDEGEQAGAYRVFWEKADGRFVSEWLTSPGAKRS
jgi:hypothetical protein